MFTTTCFGRFLWPSSGSCTVYINNKVYLAEAYPLQTVGNISNINIIIPNSGIIAK
jgi:hypothetical protein